jgi:hypothetical protein
MASGTLPSGLVALRLPSRPSLRKTWGSSVRESSSVRAVRSARSSGAGSEAEGVCAPGAAGLVKSRSKSGSASEPSAGRMTARNEPFSPAMVWISGSEFADPDAPVRSPSTSSRVERPSSSRAAIRRAWRKSSRCKMPDLPVTSVAVARSPNGMPRATVAGPPEPPGRRLTDTRVRTAPGSAVLPAAADSVSPPPPWAPGPTTCGVLSISESDS